MHSVLLPPLFPALLSGACNYALCNRVIKTALRQYGTRMMHNAWFAFKAVWSGMPQDVFAFWFFKLNRADILCPGISHSGFRIASFCVLHVRFMPTAVSSGCAGYAGKALPAFRTVCFVCPESVFRIAGKPLSQDGKAFSAMVRKCCRNGVPA